MFFCSYNRHAISAVVMNTIIKIISFIISKISESMNKDKGNDIMKISNAINWIERRIFIIEKLKKIIMNKRIIKNF